MRNMRKMDESTVSVYVNFSLFITSTIAIVLGGHSFFEFLKFDLRSTTLIIVCAILVLVV